MFQRAGDFVFDAARRYGLENQAVSVDVLERVKLVIQNDFPDMVGSWVPVKFRKGTLTIKVKDAASSGALFMQSEELKGLINRHLDLGGDKVAEIVMGRG